MGILPVHLLMAEHRLIERMIKLLADEVKSASESKAIDTVFIREAVDFIRIYTDRCHHGKEESMLFCDAARKNLSPGLKKILHELIEEHTIGRSTTAALSAANDKYALGDISQAKEICSRINQLVEFYPKHIKKEDKNFFLQSMEYFSKEEQDNMLESFLKYDREFVHLVYRKVVEKYETKQGVVEA